MNNSHKNIIKFIFTVPSHASFIPAILFCIEKKLLIELSILIPLVISSSMYHSFDSYDYKHTLFLHKIDNVFAIQSIITILLYLLNLCSEQKIFITISSIIFVLIYQTKDPWDIFNTLVPVIHMLAIMLYYYIFFGISFITTYCYQLLGLLICSVLCLYKGLDDSDFKGLRLWHSGWHICTGLLCYYTLLSNPEISPH